MLVLFNFNMAVSLLLGSRRPPSTQLFLPTEKLPILAKIPTVWARNKTPGGSGHARLSAHGPTGRFGGIFLIFWGVGQFLKKVVCRRPFLYFYNRTKEKLPYGRCLCSTFPGVPETSGPAHHKLLKRVGNQKRNR